MYTLVRRFIKTGIAFLFIGLSIGLWLLVRRELAGVWPHPYLVSAHTHAVFGGFIMFLILGVALWLFPRPPKEDTRYSPRRVELAYWILAAGTGARVIGEVIRAFVSVPPLSWIILAAGTAQLLGFALYFYAMWPRIRPVGSHLREAQGERF